MNGRILRPSPNNVQRAVTALESGAVIVIPTDTVYGVAAHITRPQGIKRLYEIKGREYTKPIPVLCSDLENARSVALEFPNEAQQLAARYWPGGLTIVVRAAPGLPDILLSGGKTVGIRIPDDDVAREVIAAAGGALAVTSANPSGEAEAHTAEEASASLGDKVALILDGGRVPGGMPSTVVDTTKPGRLRVLRHGAIDESEMRRLVEGDPIDG